MSGSNTQARPNVVLICMDDIGYGDTSRTGNPWIETRHIDSIAREGVFCTQAYTTAPLCSPSRAALLTGRYQQKFGFELQVTSGAYPDKVIDHDADGNMVLRDRDTSDFHRRGIPPEEKTMGEIFQANGYRTAIFGKWHLGHLPEFRPENRGFDESLVFLGNTTLQSTDLSNTTILSRKLDIHDEYPLTAWTREGVNGLRRNGAPVEVEEYLLWRMRDEAVAFIEANRDRPFLLYYPMNAPVPPLQVPRSYVERLSHIGNEDVRAYQALLQATDDAVGAVLGALRDNGLAENTIVLFVSDHGGAVTRPACNLPFSGGKFDTREGGIRTPFFIRWPRRLRAGTIYDRPVATFDILPTLAAAIGLELPPGKEFDGVDLMPFLDGAPGEPHEMLFFKLGALGGVRADRWKLYVDEVRNLFLLYNVITDPGETTDLSSAFRPVHDRLKAAYLGWKKTLPPPAWNNTGTSETSAGTARPQRS
jgi:arylsulfatase A-like enzyme